MACLPEIRAYCEPHGCWEKLWWLWDANMLGMQRILGRRNLHICVGQGEAWGALQNTLGPRVDPTMEWSEGPSWQEVVVILKLVRKSKRQSKTMDACDCFLHTHPYNQGFLFFSLLWETPQSQMKNLGRECGFPVQSPMTKSVNKVRTRCYGCGDFCFLLFPFQTQFCNVGHKIQLRVSQKLMVQALSK